MAEIPEFFITKYNPKAMSGDITEQVKFNHNYRRERDEKTNIKHNANALYGVYAFAADSICRGKCWIRYGH